MPESEIKLPARVVVSLRAGALLAIANVICVIIFSFAWVNVKAEKKTIGVTGSARKSIVSDLIKWQARVSATNADMGAAYADLKKSTERVVAFLKTEGIPDKQILVSSVASLKRHERDAKGNETPVVASYELSQTVEVSSTEVDKVSAIARKVTDLISEGIVLESQPPEYLYTKLADLKIEMLAEATKDATTRARQIATNSGSELGEVVEARMGVMQIVPKYSTEVSGYGMNDTSSLEKDITAVITARFVVK